MLPRGEMATLHNLPTELIDGIISWLRTDRDVSHLARTNLRLRVIANYRLYHHKPCALRWAAENGSISTARLVLDRCPELDIDEASSVNGESILSLATMNGHAHMVQWILTQRLIDVNRFDATFGRTALLHAIEKDRTDVARVLLATPGIDVNLREKGGRWTPLSLAAREGREEIVKLLLASPNIAINARDGGGYTPLISAASKGAVNVVRLLLESGNVTNGSLQNRYIKPAIWRAATACYKVDKQQRLETMKLLLNEEDVGAGYRNRSGGTLLIWAAIGGNQDIMKLLLDSGKFCVDATDRQGKSALSWAAGRSLRMMQLLHQTGQMDLNKPTNTRGCSPIWCAVQANYRQSVEWLLSQDSIDVFVRDGWGRTLLDYAVCMHLPHMVALLLASRKVNPNIWNKTYGSPLHQAVACRNDRMVKQLVDSDRVDVNMANKRGQTALSVAVENRFHAAVLALLTSSRTNVRKADKRGRTPLDLARRKGDRLSMQLLWNSGQLDHLLKKNGSSRVQRPNNADVQEYIRTYFSEAKLGWSPERRG